VSIRRFLIAGILGLAGSALYLFAFPSATIFYECIVLLHIVGGAIFLVIAVPWAGRHMHGGSLGEKLGWAVLLLGGVFGAALLFTGARRNMWPLLYTHEVVSITACALLSFAMTGSTRWLRRLSGGRLREAARLGGCFALCAGVAAGADEAAAAGLAAAARERLAGFSREALGARWREFLEAWQ